MPVHRRHRATSLVIGLGFVGLSACSSGGAFTATTTATTTTTTTSGVGTSAKARGAGTTFCAIDAQVNGKNSGIDLATSTPTEVQHFYLVTVPASVAQLKAAAPSEMSANVALLTEGLAKFITRFEQLGWNVTAASKDATVQAIGADTKYNAASKQIDAYCGITP
jgi:hypothetical protein